jgi:hypothetical protein
MKDEVVMVVFWLVKNWDLRVTGTGHANYLIDNITRPTPHLLEHDIRSTTNVEHDRTII